MSQKQNHFMGTTDMCNANCSGGSRGALNLETNFAFPHLSSTSLSVHWGKIVCSTMHYLSLKGHSSTMKIWGHSDLDPGNDITSYFYLLFFSQGFFLLNVSSLSLDTHFKYLVCNFPPNYIIIAYLPFRLTQPYPWEKDAHILLYTHHTGWEVVPLFTSTSSTRIFLCKTNPFQVPLPGRLVTRGRGYLSFLLLRMKFLFEDVFFFMCFPL